MQGVHDGDGRAGGVLREAAARRPDPRALRLQYRAHRRPAAQRRSAQQRPTARGFQNCAEMRTLWECFGSVQVRSCIGEVSCAAKYTREHCPSTPQLRALLSKSHPARSQSRLPPNLPIRKRANEQRLTALLCVCAQGRQGASRRTWTGTSFGRRKGPPPLSMARMSTRGTHCRRATNAVLSRNFPESFLDFVAISCVVSRDN